MLGRMSVKGLQQIRHLNALTSSITRPHRSIYPRLYPTVVVNPDGSTITIRYSEPRQIIKLPLNIWALSEAERKMVLERRKPKQKIKYEDDIDDDYDSNKYLEYLKK